MRETPHSESRAEKQCARSREQGHVHPGEGQTGTGVLGSPSDVPATALRTALDVLLNLALRRVGILCRLL